MPKTYVVSYHTQAKIIEIWDSWLPVGATPDLKELMARGVDDSLTKHKIVRWVAKHAVEPITTIHSHKFALAGTASQQSHH